MINILLNLKNSPPVSSEKKQKNRLTAGLRESETIKVSQYLKTILLFFTVFFATNSLFAQPTQVEGTWVTGGAFNNNIGSVAARTAINGTTILAYRNRSTATSATRTLLFNNPSDNYNPKWAANNATPLAKNTRLSGGAVRFTSGGTDINFVTVQNSYYTFIIGNSNSTNNDLAIWETSYNPTTISSVSRNFSTVDATQSPTITVTMANALGTNERVYVYYSTDNFATSGNSAFVQLSALNGSFQGTASIPTFTAGTTVTYYVLTTANTTPTFANVQYQSLNIFNGTAQNTTAANFSYTVTAAGPTPTITLGTTSGTYNANVGATSGVQTSTVTGANLTANISVTAPAYYEVSSDGGTTWASSATFTQSGGNVSGTLSIRYKPTAGENAVAKTISLTSTGATTVNYTATGTAANSITVQFQQPGDWSGSGYLYAFNGGTLNPAGIGSGWPGLIMTSLGSGWWTYTFTYTNSTVDIIFNNGNNGKQTVNITGVNSSRCYTLTGTGTNYGVSLATCPSGPTIGVNPTTATYSTTVGGTSGSQTFAVSGSFLTADIVVTAPAYYQVSKDNSSWSATGGSVSYTPVSNSVSANLYVRYVPTGAESAVAKSVTLTSTGATGQNITVTGTTSSLKVSNAVTGLWTDGSSWVGGVAPLTIDVVQIVNGATITINSNFTQTGAITVDAGGKLIATSPFVTNTSVAINGTFTIGGNLAGGGTPTVTGSGTWTYGSASTLEFRSTNVYNYNTNNDLSWPATNGPFNVSLISVVTNQNGLQINNSLVRTINGTLLVQNTNNLYQNGIGGGYTVNGTVQINSNGVFGNNVVTYGASSTLLFNTGTTITSMSGPWVTGTGGPGRGLPANVQISNNTTLSIPNSANYTVKGNLTIDSGSAVNTPSANALTVSGSVLNSGTLTLGGSANGDINVGGNWTNGGTFTHNSRTVTFNGTGNQTVSKTGGESFQNLVVNKASGNLNPDSDINIAGNFTITSGNVQNTSGSAKTITMTGAAPTLSVGGSFTGGNLGGGNNIHLIYNNASGTLNISGAGATCSFTDLSLTNSAATINLSRSIAVHGTFTVNGTLRLASGYFISNGSPIYGPSSLLLYNSGGSPTRGLEWTSATSGAGYPNNVQVGFATTLGLGTTSAQTAGFLLIDFNSTVNTTTNILTVLGSVDISGQLSLGGDVKVGGNWTVGTSGSQINNNKTVFFIGSSGNQTVRKLGGGIVYFDYLLLDKAADDVIIDSNSEIQILTTNGGSVLQLNNNGQLDLNGRTLTLGGTASNISVNAAGRTIKGAAGSTVVVNGAKTVVSSGGGTLIFDTNVKLALNSTFNFGASVTTINGVLELNSGYEVSNSPSYGTSSLLKYNSGGSPSRSTEWNSASGYGYPNDVQIAFATTLIPGGNSLQGTALNLRRDLTIDQNSSLYLDFGSNDMTVPLKVGRNAVINGNLSLSNSSGGDMEVGGNWTHTTGVFFPDARKVTFNGSNGNQTITNTGGETFYDLTVNNGSGNVLLATSTNVTVSNTLALSAGEFVSGSNTLTLNGTITRIAGTLTTDNSSLVFGPNVAALTLPNSVFTSSPSSLVNLTVNRAGGITLGNQGITASGTLTLTDGIVTTGSNIVSLTRSNASPISGGNSSTYINGKLEITYPATGTNVIRVFPIGKGGAYRPVDFIYNTDPGSRSVLLEQFETGSPFPTNSTVSTTTFGTRYWTVTQSSTGVPFRIGLDNGGVTPSAGDVVMLRKDDTTITLNNATTLFGSSYRNSVSNLFDASVVSNDVALGVSNIPLVINGITGINSKIYDSTTIATPIGTASLGGVISGDTVTLSGTPIYTFNNKNVGSGKAVTVSGYTLSGANAGAYTLPSPNQISGLTGEITARPLVVTASTDSREYNQTDSSTATPTITTGVLQGTDSANFSQTYDNKNVGTNKTLTATGVVNDGNSGNNYSYTFNTNTTGEIIAKELTIINLATADKVYDKTNVATLSGGLMQGAYPGDDVTFIPSGIYADANVGNWTVTSTTTLDGVDAGNYYLTQPTFVVKKDITPVALTITGITVQDKVYDGTTDATIDTSAAVLNGVLSGESVTLNIVGAIGNFLNKDVGVGKNIVLSNVSISGPNASNYSLSQPSVTADITPRALTITANDQTKCAGSPFSYSGNEFVKDFNVDGDVTGVTLTIVGGADGSTPGGYVLRPSSATGAGVGNYSPITYVDGSLVVNTIPTASISGGATTCLNDSSPLVTFTGANGSGTVRYKFYYRINGGSELSVTSLSGESVATVSVPTSTTRTDVYTLTRVEDFNSGCSQVQSGSANYTIGFCTQVRPLQCGKTLPALNTSIQASPITGATQYRFEVTRTDTNTVYPLITSPNYYFSPATQIAGGLVYGKSYSIKVQIFIGSWLAFGNSCIVTAPAVPTVTATKIRPNQCGATLTTVSTAIEASPVFAATQYQFEVTPQGGSAVEVTTPNYYFSLTGTAGLAAYSKAYAIRVNVLSGGNWTGFGDTCIVTTPALPTTKLVTAQCGATFNNLTFTLNSSNVPLVTKYRFRVVNGVTTRIAEVSRNYIIPSDLAGGYSNNTVYTVDVATLYNGLWSDYGPACTVTTPFIRMAAQDINTNVFEVKAFPNPFARHFSLDIQSSSDDLVQVQVYDMLGRALEVQKATVSELSTKEIGTNYPSGVYNVVVSQGDKVKSVRMIKR